MWASDPGTDFSNLARDGYLVLPAFFPVQLTRRLHAQALSLEASQFSQAAVGRDKHLKIDTQIRGDRISWMTHEDPLQSEWLGGMELLRLKLNELFFLGLFRFESHYASYTKGTGYVRHMDVLQGNRSRILSTVYYLNPQWSTQDGGHLILYPQTGDKPVQTILPEYGVLVLFLSDRFPHEVTISQRSRYSIAGWFRGSR